MIEARAVLRFIAPEIERVQAAYAGRWGYCARLADAEGAWLDSETAAACRCAGDTAAGRVRAVAETLRWGECTVSLCCEEGLARWAAPLMWNQHMVGMLLVSGVELEAMDAAGRHGIKAAADALLASCVEAGLANGAALGAARDRAEIERLRNEALQHSKAVVTDDLRMLYLREEPDLLSCIKRGDIQGARAILNRILVGIYSMGGNRLELLKSCILELVIMMSRAAVEGGADSSVLLGNNYALLAELERIDDEEELAVWVREMLERLIASIRKNNRFPHSLLLAKAVEYMRAHLDEPLRRDVVARHAGLSPGHFTRLMGEKLGKGFTEYLLQLRVERAKEMLAHTPMGLSEIAVACGFFDQSHMNKVFRKQTGMAPGRFRGAWR